MKSIFQLIIFACLASSCEKPSVVDSSTSKESPLMRAAKALFASGDSLYFRYEYDSAIQIYQQAVLLAQREEAKQLRGNLLNDIGLSFKKLGQYDSALKYYEIAAALDIERGDSTALIGRWRNIGIVHKNSGNYSRAIEVLNGSLIIGREIRNLKHEASILNSIGGIYLQQERFRRAIGYYDRAYETYNKVGERENESYALNNLGSCYEGLSILDTALNYYQKAIRLKQKVDTASMASTLYNIGNVHGKLFNYDSSLSYLSKAYLLRASLGDRRGSAKTANALGAYYMKVSRLREVPKYLDEALAYAVEHSNIPILIENYYQWSSYYKSIGNHELALEFLDKWAKMRDEAFNQEKLKTLELQSAFDVEQSENETEIAQQRASLAVLDAKQNLTISLVLLLILFLVSGFSLIFYQQRRKLIGLNKELSVKSDKIELLNKQNVHFTKNSLAGIVSMLNTQMKKLEDGKLKSTLTAEKLRMETINLLYRQLFVDGVSNQVHVKPFLEGIIQNTTDSILGLEFPLKSKLDILDIALPNEEALSLGMIVNEMCLNACKHAFSTEKNSFFASLKKNNSKLILKFSDSGLGLPPDMDWRTTQSFGIQLIRLLSEDLDADLEVTSSNEGLTYLLTIPL